MITLVCLALLSNAMHCGARARLSLEPPYMNQWHQRTHMWNQSHVEQCMAKIVEVIQPCSQRAVSNWNLNHSLFVPSKLSTCCANWQVYDCFVQASLENCNLLEFQALVHNMSIDALALQRTNCSRFRYHSEMCGMFNGGTALGAPTRALALLGTLATVAYWRAFTQ